MGLQADLVEISVAKVMSVEVVCDFSLKKSLVDEFGAAWLFGARLDLQHSLLLWFSGCASDWGMAEIGFDD